MRRLILVIVGCAAFGCSKPPQEFTLLEGETGKFTSKQQVEKRYEEMAANATNRQDITHPRNTAVEFTGVLTCQNVKTLLRFKGQSGGIWVKGDVTGQGIDANATELDARFSGGVNAPMIFGGGVVWFEKAPNPKSQGLFRPNFVKSTIVIFSSVTVEELREIKKKFNGRAVEIYAFECDLEPGRYRCSRELWGDENMGVHTLTVFAKK